MCKITTVTKKNLSHDMTKKKFPKMDGTQIYYTLKTHILDGTVHVLTNIFKRHRELQGPGPTDVL